MSDVPPHKPTHWLCRIGLHKWVAWRQENQIVWYRCRRCRSVKCVERASDFYGGW